MYSRQKPIPYGVAPGFTAVMHCILLSHKEPPSLCQIEEFWGCLSPHERAELSDRAMWELTS